MTAKTPSVKSPAPSARPGTAGRTDYDQWNSITNSLLEETEKEEQKEEEAQREALGLNGKYARSQSEADEREKAKQVEKAKKALENYQQRETAIMANLKGLLGSVTTEEEKKKMEESKPKTIRITRNDLDAGKRVITLSDTSGTSPKDTIVLTQDLSSIESQMKVNATQTPKSYPEDAENAVEQPPQQMRNIYGIIKCFISNVHDCTVIIKCKVITGTIELSHCSNVTVRIEKEATVATIQADLCQNIAIEFRDAPSGAASNKGPAALTNIGNGKTPLFWGDDTEDRIFHAGVSKMTVRLFRDDMLEHERVCDYIADGAVMVGNATPEEYQFVTSVVNEEIVTEAIVRAGSTTGKNARAMTQRELDEEKIKREKAAEMALDMAENMIKFKEVEKGGKEKALKKKVEPKAKESTADDEDVIEEIYTMSKENIKLIVDECEQNKARGNEAFGTGEYAQAILMYSLALDKADELPDTPDASKPLFARDVTLSNRAACFLKLGQHEKAEADAAKAVKISKGKNVKALFRQGLSLHAMGRYQDALPVLATASKLEPKNKQIKQALQFAEVRHTQELRRRMEQ